MRVISGVAVGLLLFNGVQVGIAFASDDPTGSAYEDGATLTDEESDSASTRTNGAMGESGKRDGRTGRRGRQTTQRTTKISVPVDRPRYCKDGSLWIGWGCAERPSKVQIGDELEPDKPGRPPRPPQPRRPRPEWITVERVTSETKSIPFPKLAVRIQPTGGLTLVNLDTNVYTVPVPFERTVEVLTWPVTVRATPASYTWHFGDGTQETTTGPGAPYPDQTVTHQYQRRGPVRVSVTVNYVGRFRVPGGLWRTIPGTIPIAGPESPLFACEARPVLIDPDNPDDTRTEAASDADPDNPCIRSR